ncbi:unnamed protein product [Schistosoma guineensis]|nr:p24 family protein gamma-3 [Schistosoma bovis]CAH8429822.1 unnamed protein product [Schistosoma intercalatum]CAH8430364.1 unnamed protein product [Schistosoma haematobium]CAH8430394.1 unnamed protein product [Schistosoma curassoni]CAH8430464.1 unnamed protein product [Schistosoma mattheei]CAH8430549.1 unnamed protein product [Schistosoma guineensis]CAH8431577.1 unnamed protein product [Schistosoma margrebowiei]
MYLSLFAFNLLLELSVGYPSRLTFELPDNEGICFYEDLPASKKYVFSYHVIHGGQTDVDIVIKDPKQVIISNVERGSDDDITFTTIPSNGTYSFCFSNEFSSISHKLIYFEIRPEDFESLAEEAGLPVFPTVMTLLDSVVEVLHHYLSRAESFGIELKNRDYGDFLVAEDLNSAVFVWSVIITFVVIITSVGQVTILKNFFSEKKVAYSAIPTSYPAHTLRT